MTVFIRNVDNYKLETVNTHTKTLDKCDVLVVCKDTVSLSASDDLDNRALCVCALSLVKTVCFHAVGLCILVLFRV